MAHSIISWFKKKYAAKGIILMYHRIAKVSSDPWDLSVSPENFEAQLMVLKHYNVISLDALTDILTKRKQMSPNTVVVTFDDGYRDNFTAAQPLLQQYHIPATFFIPSNTIGNNKEFWWDALERICLQSHDLPEKLVLHHPHPNTWNIGRHSSNAVLNPTDLYFRLCDIVMKMPSVEQQTFIKMLEIWANNTDERPEYFTMDKKELLALQADSLFTIGSHTMTHPFLPNFQYDYQKNEIQGGIQFLRELTGNRINYLAYPHGGRDTDTMKIMNESDIELAFTTDRQAFHADTNKLALPRFQVGNWDGQRFASHLDSWIRNKYPS